MIREDLPPNTPSLRHRLRFLPNLITILRIAAAPATAMLLVRREFGPALVLVLLAGVTDWLDGWAARKLGVTGSVGVVLDPAADKLLLVTLFFALVAADLIPVWLLLLVVGRDVAIVVGAAVVRVSKGVRQFSPSMLGKVSTFFQIVFVFMLLVAAVFPFRVFGWLSVIALLLTTLFTALSGLDYLRRGLAMMHEAN